MNSEFVFKNRIRELSGPQFEQLCCEMLQLTRPGVPLFDRRWIYVQRYARSGQDQAGIDVTAEVERECADRHSQREFIVFQCKRTRQWTQGETTAAIGKVTFPNATECVLILAVETDKNIQDTVRDHNSSLRSGQPHWHVWFIEDVEQHLRQRLDAAAAVSLVGRFLGEGTAQEMFKFSKPSPLVTPLAMATGADHSQRLIGREAALAALQQALAKAHQAIILPAAGGEGKTRLLIEFAKYLEMERPESCVRFIDPSTPAELEEAMQWLPVGDEVILLMDDAHRWQTDLRVCFEKLRRKWDARLRLIIGTRPYRLHNIEGELTQAGIRDIVRLTPLTQIKKADQLSLVKEVLHADVQHHAKSLVAVAGGSPLILLRGAHHLNRHTGQLNLHQSVEFRREVLLGLYDTQKLAEAHGSQPAAIQDALNLLALISSAPVDAAFVQKAAEFLGFTSPDFERLLEVLREAGHLQRSRDESSQKIAWRLLPDLAADYQACDACFDHDGHAKDFPAKFWDQLGSDVLIPFVLQNLSEAEYIARLLQAQAPRVTTPLIEALKTEYRQAGWDRRLEILALWERIGALQPQEALQQVREAIRLQSDQPVRPPSEFEAEFDVAPPSFASAVEKCADIVAVVGTSDLDSVTACLDLLWEIDAGRYSDLLNKVSEICSAACWGPPVFAEQAMPWIKSRLHDPKPLPSHDRLGGLLHAMLDGCFKLELHESESDGRTITGTTYSMPFRPTKHLRAEALTICTAWLCSAIPQAQHAAAHFFRSFFVPNHMPAKAEERNAWRVEQADAAEALLNVIHELDDAATLWIIRQTLVTNLPQAMQEESGHHVMHDLLAAIPDTFELRIHRLFLSNSYSDIPQSEAACARSAVYQSGKAFSPEDEPVWHATFEAEHLAQSQAWNAFVESTTREVLDQTRDASSLWKFLQEWENRLKDLGSMTTWEFLQCIYHKNRTLLHETEELWFTDRSAGLEHLFAAFDHAWQPEPDTRATWTLRALQSAHQPLTLRALSVLRFHREINLQEQSDLRVLAGHGSLEIRLAVVGWAKEAQTYFHHQEIVFGILAGLRIHEDENSLLLALSECLLTWLGSAFSLPTMPHGAEILQKLLLLPDLGKDRVHDLLKSWSRHDPAQVVTFLEKRIQHWHELPPDQRSGYRPVGGLELRSLETVPEIREKLASAFQQWCSAQEAGGQASAGLWASWFHLLGEGAWETYLSWLDVSLEMLSEDRLRLALEPLQMESQIPFYHPDLTEKLLARATQMKPETQQRIRRWLHASLFPRSYSSRPGEPRGHDLRNREKAQEFAAKHRLRPLLHEFYLTVVKNSDKAIQQAKDEPSWWPDDE